MQSFGIKRVLDIAALLNLIRPAYHILKVIKRDYDRADNKPGRKSWETVVRGMAGLTQAVLSDTDLPEHMQ